MLREYPEEPWRSFLNGLDGALGEPVALHCIGGFAAVQAYGLQRATADIDVLTAIPFASSSRLIELAGKQSALRKKYGVYLDMAPVVTAPLHYEERLAQLYAGCWEKLMLCALEAHDLALTKLEPNYERDRSDVAYLASAGYLDAAELRRRYVEEVRPYMTGRVNCHDQTLELWIEAYFQEGI